MLRALMAEAATGAQQDGHLVEDHLVDEVRFQRGGLTQPESVELLARRVPVGVPVEEHGRVTKTASELLVAVGVRPLI